MSEFKADYDVALRQRPWLAKAVHGTPYLLKHTTFDRRSIFLVTNLQSTYYEILRSPDVLVRNKDARKALPPLSGSTEAANGDESIVVRGGDAAEEADEVRSKLEKMISPGEGWDGVDISMGEEDDFYDIVINLQSDDFSWILKLTKIIDTQSIVLLRDHLTIPLLGLVGAMGNVLEQTGVDVGKIAKAIDASSLAASRRLAPLLSSTMITPTITTGLQRWSAGWSGKKGKDLPLMMTEWVEEDVEEPTKDESVLPEVPAQATRSHDTEKERNTRARKRSSSSPSSIGKVAPRRVLSPTPEPLPSPLAEEQPAASGNGNGSDTEEKDEGTPVDQSNTDPQDEVSQEDDDDEGWDSDMTIYEDDEEAVKLHEERMKKKGERPARKRKASSSPQNDSGKAAKRAHSVSVQSEVFTEAERTARASELRKAVRQQNTEDVKKGKDEIARLEQETRDRLRTGTPVGAGAAVRARGRGRGRGRPLF